MSDTADAKARIVVEQDKGRLRELQLSAEALTGKPVGEGQLRRADGP